METKSEIREEPLFSLRNFFRPTTKNVLIWGTSAKVGCASIIAFATTLVTTNVTLAVVLIILGLGVGFLADTIISFTREKPVDTLVQAVVDIKQEEISKDV